MKNKKLIIFITIILLVGIGLRTFKFGDLLIFKSDQARDAIIMDQALINGFSTLSLLGPQVGGTQFRIGPISYYFQYLSGKIFGANPESYAYPDLLWGIIALPILYIIFRRFFSTLVSLWLFTLSSVSLFLITFSRFAWNPNGLPFFTALFSWLFLKLIEKEKGKRWKTILLFSLTIGIIFQLHLAAAISIILGLFLFIIFYRTFSCKEIVFSIFIVILAHFPLLVYEWQTQGKNLKEFKTAFMRKESIGENHNFLEKTFRAYQENARIIWLPSTGQTEFNPILTRGFSIKCDKDCKKSLPISFFSITILSLALLNFYKKFKKITNQKEKEALAFFGSWLIGFFLVTIFLAYQLEIRFYLGIVPIIFLLLGFLAEKIITKNKYFNYLIFIFGITIIGINLKATLLYLNDLSKAKSSFKKTGYDLRFGSEPKVTLEQFRMIAEKVDQDLPKNIPVIINGENRYVKSLYYVIVFEKGYWGCYFRGEKKEIPSGFNNITLKELGPNSLEGSNFSNFGTLTVSIQKSEEIKNNLSLPEGCFNY